MKRIITMFVALALFLTNVFALAESIDFSAYDDAALLELYQQVQAEVDARGIGDTAAEGVSIMQVGSKGEDVKVLQENLILLGFLSGTADGDFGNNTQNAILAYQRASGLAEDGLVTQELYDRIADSAASMPAPVSRFTAEELYNKFNQNTLAAEEELKGVEFEVSGKIDSIDSNVWGDYYVKLAADSWGLYGVYCYFDDSMKSEVAKLVKGQTVVIRGIGNGADMFGDPEMNSCQIVG